MLANNNRLRRIQKVSEQSSWRTKCKRKRQIEAAASSSMQSPAASRPLPFQMDQLPLNTLVVVASHLPFADFKNIGFVSSKFNTVQRLTRYSRKRISVDLLRKLFPDEPFPSNAALASSTTTTNKADQDCMPPGILQVIRPLSKTLRSSPPLNIREVDLSEFSAVRKSHFDELFKSVDNGRELFAEVQRLNVQGCIVEIKDMAFLAQLMPKIWFIRCSAHSLVLPEGSEIKTLSPEQMQMLRSRVENFANVSQQFTRKHLWFLAQLTELFLCLEVVQLDN